MQYLGLALLVKVSPPLCRGAGHGGSSVCEGELRFQGRRKLQGEGVSVSTGAPLGAGGKRSGCGQAPRWHRVHPGLLAPPLGSWGDPLSSGGQICRTAGALRGDAPGCLRGLAFRVVEGQPAPRLLSMAPIPGKHHPAGGCGGIPVAYMQLGHDGVGSLWVTCN